MNKYFRLIKKIKIHPLFWVVSGISILLGYFWELLILFMIVLLHELAHAVSAQYFNWKIRKIMILPFGGFCDVDEHGNRRMKEELLVVAAGPSIHLLIGMVTLFLQMSSLISSDYAQLIYQCNTMILLFNLLPIWPLDGGKFVYLFLSKQKPFITAFRMSLISSFIFLGIIYLIVLLLSPLKVSLWIVLSYLFLSLWAEWKQQRYVFIRFLLERHYGNHYDFSELQSIEAKGEEYVYETLEKFKRGYKHLIYVESQQSVQRKLDENELLYAYFTEKRTSAQLKELVYD